MDKLDLRKTYKTVYSAGKEPGFVEVPRLGALAIDGAGDPDGAPWFAEATGALYAAAYSLKFAFKKARGIDWTVLPLEGDWYCERMEDFSSDRKDEWLWTLFVVQPDAVGAEAAAEAIRAAAAKKPCAAADAVRFMELPAHRAAHLLHVGPYEAETPTIRRLHDFIAEQGLSRVGRHHEIYLSDPRRSAPEAMKTIIRQPVG
ncbi:MAG: GyrI-like domain-containing protein [Spirochaetes bacterium]|nr:GyrI-like domain-containing protein [Spirochaetota bacterium]